MNVAPVETTTSHNISRVVIAYLAAFFFCTIVLVYGVRLPLFLTGEKDLVYEYYVKHGVLSMAFDVFLIAIYLGIAYLIIWWLGVSSNSWQCITVILTTFFISSVFMIFFLCRPRSTSFFSRWFHAVTWRAIFYDMILVTSVFIIARQLFFHLK